MRSRGCATNADYSNAWGVGGSMKVFFLINMDRFMAEYFLHLVTIIHGDMPFVGYSK